jgi:hypothetical protein
MNGREFLKTSHLPKPLHGPFPPPEGLMRIFRSIVQPTACLLTRSVADRSEHCPVRAKLVGDDGFRLAISFHRVVQQPFCRSGIPAPLVPQVWSSLCPQHPTSATSANGPLASRRDGDRDGKAEVLSLAGRRHRGRGFGFPGPASPEYQSGRTVDAQAPEEARLCAVDDRDRQTRLVWCCEKVAWSARGS